MFTVLGLGSISYIRLEEKFLSKLDHRGDNISA